MDLYQEYATGTTSSERDLYDASGTPYFSRNTYHRTGYTNSSKAYIPQYESCQVYSREDLIYTPVGLKFLAFDIDSSSTLEAIIDAKKLVTWLELYNVNDYKIYWSGSKGIHITISWYKMDRAYDEYTLKTLHTLINKYVSALSGVKTFDLSIYNNRSLLRMENTRNIKTGLYKILISRELLFCGDVGEIEILSRSPEFLHPEETSTSDYGSLARLYDFSYDFNQLALDRPTNYTDNGAIESVDFVESYLSSAIIRPGTRHQVSNVLAAYFMARGLSQDQTYQELAGFMSKATGTTTPINQRVTESRNDVRTCYSNQVRFSFYKAKEVLQ